MLPINKELTPYNLTKKSNKKNEYIVVHYTGALGTAKNNADYFYTAKRAASASYFVDNTSIWQSVEDKNAAWHCGGGLQGNGGHTFHNKCTNSNSIGIEMCCKKDSLGNLTIEQSTINNTLDLIRYLMKKHSIPINKVIRHYDVTGKLCPAQYVDETAWGIFKQNIVKTEGELTMDQYNELKTTITALNTKIEKLSNPTIYNWVDNNMPVWAKPTVIKLKNKGYLKGDSDGKLNLTDDMLRIMVVLDRSGAFDNK